MRKLIFTMLLLPLLAISQNSTEYGVLENVMITPNPSQLSQFEAGLAAHNKKYHGNGAYGARVYWISSGPNAGSYMWVMGPTPWSAMDARPAQVDGHDADWNKNVAAYAMPQGNTTYWKFNAEMSRFSKDFTLKNLLLDTYDVKRGKMKEAMALVEKIGKVYAQKLPNEIYGIYTNEFSSTKEGKDLTVVSFFDKMGWISEDNGMDKKFDEVHGKGSWDKFLEDWYDVTDGGETELWIFRPELSGISGDVKAADRK
ncbi:hypothetical protein [Aequorivita lipolytica]|nr:hypothetical protein [Aequorivita lipolytica]